MESIPLLSPYETGRFRFSHRLDDLFYHSFSKLDSFIVLYFISLLSSVHQTFSCLSLQIPQLSYEDEGSFFFSL
jgi:hypothetical protein